MQALAVRLLTITLFSISLIISSTSMALAQNEQATESGRIRLVASPTPRQHSGVAELKLRSLTEVELGAKLNGGKLRACQNRAEAIAKSATSVTSNATKIIEKLDSIAVKIKNFQTEEGITLENDEFVSTDLQNQKQASMDAVSAAKTTAESFNCESESPKKQLRDFILAMDAARESIQNYKVAVHNYANLVRQGDFKPAEGAP